MAKLKTTTCADCGQEFPVDQTVTMHDTTFPERVDGDYDVDCAWQQIGCATYPNQYKVTRNEALLEAGR